MKEEQRQFGKKKKVKGLTHSRMFKIKRQCHVLARMEPTGILLHCCRKHNWSSHVEYCLVVRQHKESDSQIRLRSFRELPLCQQTITRILVTVKHRRNKERLLITHTTVHILSLSCQEAVSNALGHHINKWDLMSVVKTYFYILFFF